MKTLHVLIAPNALKGSLNAWEVAATIGRAFEDAGGYHCTLMPIADGGDDFLQVMLRATGSKLCELQVSDPLGRAHTGAYGLSPEGTAIVEMAQVSGLALMKEEELNPLKTSSLGTGELIAHALESGCRSVLLGIGGSATHDCGMGILHALGVRFLDMQAQELRPCGAHLEKIDRISLENLHPRLSEVIFRVACDVTNPLLGPEGAAAVFAPQKGADPETVKRLEAGSANFSRCVEELTGNDLRELKGGGAAGGIAAGLHGLLGVSLQSGTELVLEQLGFAEKLKQADLLVTGEGKIDTQTLDGKGPHGLALKAKSAGKPIIAFAGAVPTEKLADFSVFDAVFTLVPAPVPLEKALENAAHYLYASAYQVAKALKLFR